MKKEKAIIIKSPRLRRARNELRTLLSMWVSDIINSLQDKFWSENNNHKSKEIHKKISDMRLMLERSICYCRLCGKSDQDMIYIPTEKEWICLECYSSCVYFKNLRSELQSKLNAELIEAFLERLAGEEGISLTRLGSRCNGYAASKRILDRMGIDKKTQDKFLELCHYYGGHCDCEIIFNAKPCLLEK